MFSNIDVTNSGVLTKSAVRSAAGRFKKYYNMEDEDAERIVHAYYMLFHIMAPHKDSITREEFINTVWRASFGKTEATLNRYKNAYSAIFDVIETAKKGRMSFEEFKSYWHMQKWNDSLCEATFKWMDKENNGYVTKEQFNDMALAYYDLDDIVDGVEADEEDGLHTGYNLMWGPIA
ncbi:unnamed protein product [Owenia fusiformis]|uniref:Uncharacterized protein n=2 Tax=Owenia fusiformis TaxID=6347 RepID=A0A8J1TIJ7_OWEFU|nr:unnamed protein product [Owenia fusiformis]